MKIRYRIMFGVAGAGLLSSLVFSLVIFLEMREQPLKLIDAQLRSEAAAVAQALKRGQQSADPDRSLEPAASPDRYWIKVVDGGGRVLYQSALSRLVDLPLRRSGSAYMIRTHVPKARIDLQQDDGDEVTFRVRVTALNLPGGSGLVQIARPVENLEEETSDLLMDIAVGLAVSAALLLALSHAMAGRIVKPLAAMNRLAREITAHSLEKRIPETGSRDELQDLAACLNQMFDRLQFSFSRQKQFLADASHELKSPIAMLRLFFDEAVLRHDLPESFQHQLDVQGRHVLRMDRLVKTLLELSVLEIQASPAWETFDGAALIRSVQADFLPLMERAGIGFESEMPDLLPMRGDREQIRRAFINLLDNALKYGEENGRVRVAVSVEKTGIRLSVFNTGQGIPREDLPRVFDAFYRVDKSRSSRSGGAGLGLAIVKRIAELHGGSAAAESEPGKWAEITLRLPSDPSFRL